MPANPGHPSDPNPWLRELAAARLVVAERTGTWAVALRQASALTDTRVYETRSLAECWQMLPGYPSSFLVLEATPVSIDGVLDYLARIKRQYPLARAAVVADPSLSGHEWLIREAGAVHFLTSRRGAGPLALVARRHLSQIPEPRHGLAERIWAELPWA